MKRIGEYLKGTQAQEEKTGVHIRRDEADIYNHRVVIFTAIRFSSY